MKRRLTHSQLESMISECVAQTLMEAQQPKKNYRREVMTESQMRNYIQRIINEEMDNEGFLRNLRDGVKAFASHAWNNGLKGSMNAGMNTFNTQQAQDKDIRAYNKGKGQYDNLSQQYQQLKQQKTQIEQQMQEIESQMAKTSGSLGKFGRNGSIGKAAGRQGMDASQYRQWQQQQQQQGAQQAV